VPPSAQAWHKEVCEAESHSWQSTRKIIHVLAGVSAIELETSSNPQYAAGLFVAGLQVERHVLGFGQPDGEQRE
jgi:hypothetical protein